ncbi:HAD-like domain-containing protein [Biscogniauxia sp. FL1348]|nr:HAD-like domain-containing protein [Biscogniauxia sp. FL1348]
MASNEKHTVAFAFDIDGILVKGPKALPGARETIKKLQESHIPFIFLTNNGGRTEEAQVEKLGEILELPLTVEQFIQSHSPFKALVPTYRDKTILALGGHGQQVRDLARAYGFKNVLISSDIVAGCEFIHPFPEMTRAHHEEHGCARTVRGHDKLHATQISAILMWTSSRDWCLDLQIIRDLLLSQGGYIGTRSAKNGDSELPNHGYQQDGQPALFFSNPDVEWVTPYAFPRLAQGAFRESLKAIWAHDTDGKAELQYTLLGKPSETTYEYAEKTLLDYHELIGKAAGVPRKKIRTVYMIGDNPESDIKGANSFRSRHGLEWKSVLCETGVYVAGTEPRHKPTYQARDVREAVQLALREEGIEMDIDMDVGATEEEEAGLNGRGYRGQL